MGEAYGVGEKPNAPENPRRTIVDTRRINTAWESWKNTSKAKASLEKARAKTTGKDADCPPSLSAL